MMMVPAGATPLGDFNAAWAVPGAGPRLRAVTVAAERLRDRFAGGPRVVAVRTLPLSTLLYPTKYAFNSCASSPAPFVVLTHRCVLVQFLQAGTPKTLLFNPTDLEGARATPFLAGLIARVGERAANYLAGSFEPLVVQLAHLGIPPDKVDYIAFDHLHTQDLRPVLGTTDGASSPRFPNATFLVRTSEWEDLSDPHPYQRPWFVPGAKRGVRMDRAVLLGDVSGAGGDIALGDGVLLVRTPGHTSGNQTLFLNTEQGVWGISENGTSADNWSPLDSKISGLATACRKSSLDVAVNANTPEGGAQQYTSMILERTLVDRVRRAPAFVQMFPSSEVTPSKLAPGLAPTVLHRAITGGDVVRPGKGEAAA
jgi:hypothetical protein